jgi:quinol monooxygenase YgiN
VSRITVVSRVLVKEGETEQVLKILRRHIANTHEEEGVLGFALHRDLYDERRFAVIEAYRDVEALERHRQTPSYQRSMAELPALLEEWPDTKLYTPLPEGDPVKGTVWAESG